MAFQKLQFNLLTKTKMLNYSKSFLTNISSRRSVRDFSDEAVPTEIITNAGDIFWNVAGVVEEVSDGDGQ